jgi:hypothetical protein
MTKVYLLVYGKDLGTRPRIKACLNELPQVISWRSEMPNSFFIQSEADALTLGAAIHSCMGAENPRFLLTEIPNIGKRWGWLTQASWNFIKKPIIDAEKKIT